MRLNEIHLRDPFVLPVTTENRYYLFGTTDVDCFKGPFAGFDCYRSADLVEWEGPIPAFRPPAGFWATMNFWAPEVHAYGGEYYMFASFKAPQQYRGTQILHSPTPQGPYMPLTDRPVTPAGWECLDGTLYVDSKGDPWIVFCHEWVQVHDGEMCAARLSKDLRQIEERPISLFNASEAPWVRRDPWPVDGAPYRFPTFVTDGPFLYRDSRGGLQMLWSSRGNEGYAMGIARSQSGEICGPWLHDPTPIWGKDGGHGMLFRTFDGRLMMTLHAPNQTPHERPVFVEVEDRGGNLRIR